MFNDDAFDSQIVLVIDDDENILQYVQNILSCVDITICEATTADAALKVLEEVVPDIILLDIHLPGKSGMELLKQLNNNVRYASIPVLIMTSDVTDHTVNDIYEYEIYDYIQKPLTASLLYNRLKNAIKRKKVNSEYLHLEKKLHQLQHITGMGYWEYDTDTNVFSCSDEIYEILDIDKNCTEFNLYSFLALSHDEDIDIVSESINHAINDGTPYTLEHRIFTKDNDELIVLHQGESHKKQDSNKIVITATITDITERKQTQNLIEYNSSYDKLTGLPNRNLFCRQLGQQMVENDRNEKLIGLIFVGIDRFKNINEGLGRNVGDELLLSITNRLNILDDCFIARFSGDVFSITVENNTTIDNILNVTTLIRKLVENPFKIDGHEIYITVSMGVSVYPINNADKEKFINHSETAMYYSKNLGGNRISCFETSMIKTGKKRLFIETDLRKAIEKEQFEIFYQPQVSVENRRLIGMEALIRWNHPRFGVISPDDFIPIAEDTGLILPIGEWVLEEATKQVATWINDGAGLLRVGINISPKQFENKLLSNTINKALSNSGLMPCSLDLELTESSAMRDIKQTIAILNEFKEMGVQTSLDDFGTGYSSLNYLRTMPLHTLKIDRAFIRDIKYNGQHGELAKMIISMCHALGLNVIAEGVETEGHLEFLRQHECSEAQGYLFSRPVDKFSFEQIIHDFSTIDITTEIAQPELLIFS